MALRPRSGCLVSVLLALLLAPPSPAAPTIALPVDQDLNRNGVDDDLDALIATAVAEGDPARPTAVIVTLFRAPRASDLALFASYGGRVRHRYSHATYGFAGPLPANRVHDLAAALGSALALVERDAPGRGTLDDSARQVRVRPLVWAGAGGYGLDGDGGIVIAILDSGIDGTHTDLSGGRVAFWHDFTSEAKPTVTDENRHGTHVASIAAGTGAALGSGPVSSLTTTMSGRLPTVDGNGFADMIKVPVLGSGQVTSNLAWQGAGTAQVNLALSVPGWQGGVTSAISPLIKTWNIGVTDVYKARAGNHSGLAGAPYSMLVTYPYAAVGDGFNLFRGMAPGSDLAGFKILRIDNTGNASDWTAAFDSLAAINATYDIKVANASVSLDDGGTNLALRTAVDGCVAAGTVVCIAAGNSFGSANIGDPGLAEKAVTVGAINDFGAMTDYSSNGGAGTLKPDVVAPGGSHSWDTHVGTEITASDTNVNDAHSPSFADRQANDYTNLNGTSMAAPHVAGVAALVIDAQETYDFQPWPFSENAALRVKALLQATATETNRPGEESSGNDPPLDRGGKDRVEGFGRVNADAAVEAVIQWMTAPPDTMATFAFGNGVFDRQAWATEVGLCGPDSFLVALDVPDGADFDLYLYESTPNPTGEPILVGSSAQATPGADESVRVDLGIVCLGYWAVAKRVSGSGTATFRLERYQPTTDVADVGDASRPWIGPGFPNPFSDRTTVPYRLAGSGSRPVRLEIYDLRGARVRSLVETRVEPGRHRVTWDGRDEEGGRVAAGVYFAKLVVGETVRTQRLTVLR